MLSVVRFSQLPARASEVATEPNSTAPETAPAPAAAYIPPRQSWGVGRIIAIGVCSLILLSGLGWLLLGLAGVAVDKTQRNSAGYMMTGSDPITSHSYALVSPRIVLRSGASGFIKDLLGSVAVRVHSSSRLFIGIGPASAVNHYLRRGNRLRAGHLAVGSSGFDIESWGKPHGRPGKRKFWDAKTVGPGTRTLSWSPHDGSWRGVLMNANASRGVHAAISVGATVPILLPLALAILVGGVIFLTAGGIGFYFAIRTRH